MTTEDLREWRGDICKFAESLWTLSPASGQVEPLRLQAHQQDFLRAATARDAQGRFIHRTCVASWPRREGKTLCAAILGAWRLVCWGPGQRCLVLANSREQAASNIYDAIEHVLRETPTLAGLVPEDCFGKNSIRVPALDNEVTCLPNAWRTVQGRRCDLLCSDELHAAGDTRAYDFAARQSEGVDAQVVLSTQAGDPDDGNPIWRLYNAQAEVHIYFSYLTEHRTPWGQALADRDRAEMLDLQWRYQHLNEWGNREDALFGPDDVDRARARGEGLHLPLTVEEFKRIQHVHGSLLLTAGLDRAQGARDHTVLTLVGKDSRRGSGREIVRVIAMARWLEHSLEDIVGTLREWCGRYGYPMHLWAESYGSQDVVNACLGLCHAELIPPSGARQTQGFGRLATLLREGRLVIPAEGELADVLCRELKGMKYEVRGGGLLSFSGKEGSGQRRRGDDSVYAVMWAAGALATLPTFGTPPREDIVAAFEVGDLATVARLEKEERDRKASDQRFAEAMQSRADYYV